MWACNRWFNLRGQCSCALISGIVAAAVVLEAKAIGSIMAGLVLIYSTTLSSYLTDLSRAHADCQVRKYEHSI